MVIDRLIDGIAGGGTRMRAGLDLQEVERLAHTMSIKNGAIKLPGGGAKGGLDCDPHDPEARAMLRSRPIVGVKARAAGSPDSARIGAW